MSISSFASVWMCGNGDEGGVWGKGGARGLVDEGQLIHNMGLKWRWREVCILAQWATTPSKGYLFFRSKHHTCANNSLQMFLNMFYVFSSSG